MGRGGGQGGCERRTEVFVKIKNFFFFFFFFFFFGGGGGVRVDMNQELKFFGKFKNKLGGGGMGPGGSGGGVGLGGQDGCERRIEVFVKIKKKSFFFFFFFFFGGGGVRVWGSGWM